MTGQVLPAPAPAVSARQLADFRLPGGADDAAQDRMRAALSTLWGDQSSASGQAARSALQVSATMTSLVKDAKPAHGAKYPNGDLGTALAASARVIRAGVGARGDHPRLRRLGHARRVGQCLER